MTAPLGYSTPYQKDCKVLPSESGRRGSLDKIYGWADFHACVLTFKDAAILYGIKTSVILSPSGESISVVMVKHGWTAQEKYISTDGFTVKHFVPC